MKRWSPLLLLTALASPARAGSWFPPEYKTFPFQEGDLLASQGEGGKWSVSKILKVDKIVVKKGKSIGIQGQRFVAPEDDFLLVVSASYGEDEFDSLEAAAAAAKAHSWHVKLGHIPNRAPGAAEGQKRVGHEPVRKDELAGYRLWRAAFDKGEAGVF
jgi:hypothetical protein